MGSFLLGRVKGTALGVVAVGKAATVYVGDGPPAFVAGAHGQCLVGLLQILVLHGGQPLMPLSADDARSTVRGVDRLLLVPPDVGRTVVFEGAVFTFKHLSAARQSL